VDGDRSALIVASDGYTDPGLKRLRAPASDAAALGAVLRDPEIGGFEVRTLLNEPAHEVNLAVEEFFADRRPDDLLLMHFSCHGVKDEGGELYFAMANTLLRRLGATAVAAEFVNRRMSRSRSRRIVLLLDCCYAGAFERGMTARAGEGIGIESQLGGRGRAVITASSAMEYAFEGNELTDTRELAPSVFTSALVEGLETGDADRDQDGLVALDELYDYIYDKVRTATPNQTPGKWAFGVQGELVIARRARPVTTPAPLPPELQEAIDSRLAAVRGAAVQELARLLHGKHAGQALAARLALERLTGDDSRIVAAAATAALRPQAQGDEFVLAVDPTAEGEHAGTVSVDSDGGSAALGRARSGMRKDSVFDASTAPVVIAPSAVPAPPPATSAGGAAAGPATQPTLPSTDVDHVTAAQRNDDRRLLVAGELAIVGAALLVVGLFPAYEWGDSLWTGRGGDPEMRWFVLYALILAVLVAGAGACTLLPRTRRLIGPGLLLGIVAASTWGLLYLPSHRIHKSSTPFGGGWWFELVAHLVLVVAACLAGLALVRTADVRLTRPRPHSQLPWLVALLGGAGALALLFHDKNLWYVDSQYRWYAVPSIWVSVLALAVPACAAVAVPRRFGVALLAGWIAGGADLFGVLYLWDRYQENGAYGTTAIITFGFTLLALVAVTVLFARAAPDSEAERAA